MTDPISGNTFTNGGIASVNEDKKTLTLSNITPGDKVTFNIKVTNNSNVASKYRTVMEKLNDTGLYNGLVIKFNKEEIVGTRVVSSYTALSTDTKEFKIPVEVYFPSDRANIYQDKTCELAFNVEAIQGNAFDHIYNVTPSNVQEVLDKVVDGDTVILGAGNYETLYLRQNKGASTRREDLDKNHNQSVYAAYTRSIKDLTIKAESEATVNCKGFKSEAGLFNYETAPASNQNAMVNCFVSYLSLENIVLDGINFNDNTQNSIVLRDNASGNKQGSTFYVDNFIVKNCTGTGNTENSNIHFFTAGSDGKDDKFLSTGKKGLNNIYLVNNTMTSYNQAITFNNDVSVLTNFTAKDNKFNSCIGNNIQMSNKLNDGSIVFDGNTITSMNGRFLRLAGASSSAIFEARNNKIVTPIKYEDEGGYDLFKITGTAGFTVIESNNEWLKGSFSEDKKTWISNGDTSKLSK